MGGEETGNEASLVGDGASALVLGDTAPVLGDRAPVVGTEPLYGHMVPLLGDRVHVVGFMKKRCFAEVAVFMNNFDLQQLKHIDIVSSGALREKA